MKKVFKIFGIFLAVLFIIGTIGLALETPEQRAEREAQEKTTQQTNAPKTTEQANTIQQTDTPVNQPIPEQSQPTTTANFGMTPQEFGKAVDDKINSLTGAKTKLGEIQTTGSMFSLDLGAGVFWTGNIDKDGKISASSYRMTVKPNDNDKTIAFLAMAGATALVLHPELPKEQSAGKVATMATNATNKALQTKDSVTDTLMIGDYKHYVEIYPSTNNIVIGVVHKDQ